MALAAGRSMPAGARLARFLGGTFLLLALTGVAFAAEVAVPGSRVVLEPPPNFTASDRFAGFVSKTTGAFITVADLPGEAFRDIALGFTPAALATKGLHLRSSEPMPAKAGRTDGLLIELEQTAAGQRYRKWVAVIANPTVTALVTVAVPDQALSQVPESAVRQTLFGARLAGPRAASALPFSIEPHGTFLRRHDLMGTSVVFSDGVVGVDDPRDRPVFVASVSIGPPAPVPPERFARQLAGDIAGLRDVRILGATPVTIAGLNGWVHKGEAVNGATGTATALYHVVLPAADRYYRLVGLTPTSLAERVEPAFQRMAASLQPRR